MANEDKKCSTCENTDLCVRCLSGKDWFKFWKPANIGEQKPDCTEYPVKTCPCLETTFDACPMVLDLRRQLTGMTQWKNDLLSGMYVNCVYCGHRYGPNKKTPVAVDEVLKQHIEICPKHPMSILKKQLADAQAENERLAMMNVRDDKEIDRLKGMLFEHQSRRT